MDFKKNGRKPKHNQTAPAKSRLWKSDKDQLLPNLTNLSRRDTIERYHTISKQLAAVDRDPRLPNEAAREVRRQTLRAQLKVIGIDEYQNASLAGEETHGGFDSSKWVLQELKTSHSQVTETGCLRLLDVGAIVHRFPGEATTSSGIRFEMDVTSIDLHPHGKNDGLVIKVDFLSFAKEHLQKSMERFDVVCLSLCVNFEGCPQRRGEMLQRAAQLLRPRGLLFIVLPKACVENSRYCDQDVFRRILKAVGFVTTHFSLSQSLFKCVAESGSARPDDAVDSPSLVKKELVRQGKRRNNFTISILPSSVDTVSEDMDSSKEKPPDFARADMGMHGLKSGIQKRRTSNQRKRTRMKARRVLHS